VDVDDVKSEADRLRDEGVEVGVVVEIPQGVMRLLDVYDPDGNRIDQTTAHTSSGTGQGQWPLPSFGLVYHGKAGPATKQGNGIVCVQPAEADGGVLPAGRAN
jgi:hypothetical protein